MQAVWRQACGFDEVNQNVAFASECHDKRWFCNTHCGGLGMDRGPDERIWDLLVSIDAPHDPLAVIACVPSLCERLLRPAAHFVEAGGSSTDGDVSTSVITKHLVAEAGGVNAKKTRDFLLSTIEAGLSLERSSSAQRAPSLIIMTDAGQDLDDEMTMVLMRALTDRGLVKCKGAVATLAPSRARARLVRGKFRPREQETSSPTNIQTTVRQAHSTSSALEKYLSQLAQTGVSLGTRQRSRTPRADT